LKQKHGQDYNRFFTETINDLMAPKQLAPSANLFWVLVCSPDFDDFQVRCMLTVKQPM